MKHMSADQREEKPRRRRDMTIHWTVVATVLGQTLVAATTHGICAVEPGKDENHLLRVLRAEFPQARLQRVQAGGDVFLSPRLQAVTASLAGRPTAVAMDLIGTAFQRRVWEALMRIPAGQTRSYTALATTLGMPQAGRAVASACARNRIAVLVPCHRVIRRDGTLAGYRWGLPLKQRLLQHEATLAAGPGSLSDCTSDTLELPGN